LMTAPLTALVLGIGVQATYGLVTNGPGDGDDDTVVAVGMAVVGCVLIFIGALCPLVLFKLLAFVDPGTSSGVSMRAGLAAAGGVGGLLGGSAAGSGGQFSGSSAAAYSHSGRSGGESNAGAATQGRFAAALGPVVGGVNSAVLSTARSGAAAGADTLNAAGIGHQSHYLAGQTTHGAPSAADGSGGQRPDGYATPGGDTGLDTPGADSAPPAPGGERTDDPAPGPLSGRGAQTAGGPPTSPAGQAPTPVGAPLAGAAAVRTDGVAGAGGAEAAGAAAG
jgi:type IV secretion system protein TrbL